MADYSQVNDYSAKDALATGNPLKLIKGSDVDQEFSAIATAISSKFDSTDVATAMEAQAGTSNTVVITPARLTAWGQNGAGVIEDIQKLQDPDADRVLFWDDSAGTTTWLDLGPGLTIVDTSIDIDPDGATFGGRTLTAGLGLSGGGTLDADMSFDFDLTEIAVTVPVAANDFLIYHDASEVLPGAATIADVNAVMSQSALSDYNANADIDLTTVTITAGEGLSYSVGGTDISADATIDFDLNSLTSETVVDPALDQLAYYDASATAVRKIAAETFIGTELGDGHWYRSSTQALSAGVEATVVYNAEEYDNLQRGTFSTSTGEYTATEATRLWVSASVAIAALDDDDSVEIEVQVGGVTKLRYYQWNDTENDTPEVHVQATGTLNLSASDVVRVRATTSSGETISAGTQNTRISIMELA